MRRNRYSKDINDRTYYVHVSDFNLLSHVTVAVRDGYSRERSTTYVKERKWFCDDVDRFAANMLADAVNVREDRIEDRQQYDERVERALDAVQESHQE